MQVIGQQRKLQRSTGFRAIALFESKEIGVGVEVPTGYWKLDLKTWELELCGASRSMFGLACKADLLTQDEWTSRIHPDDLGPVMEQLWITAEVRDHSYSQPFRSIHSDGSVQQILGVGNALYEGPGAAAAVIGSNIDLVSASRLICADIPFATDAEKIADRDSRAANENCENMSLQVTRPAGGQSFGAGSKSLSDHGEAVRGILRERAKAILKVRRSRLDYFDRTLLGEPAFEMLLALYSGVGEGGSFSMEVLAASLGLPLSQVRRWLASLNEAGLVNVKALGAVEEGADTYLTYEGQALVEAFLEFIVANGF